MEPDWVVFSKLCPTHTGSVIDYLGRYSHRIAISDQRIVGVGNEQVRFQYKNYAGGGQRKTMALDAVEFIRRYLLHVLPKGLMRIRHYGLLANRCRRKKIKLVREALNATNDPVKGQEKPMHTDQQRHRHTRRVSKVPERPPATYYPISPVKINGGMTMH